MLRFTFLEFYSYQKLTMERQNGIKFRGLWPSKKEVYILFYATSFGIHSSSICNQIPLAYECHWFRSPFQVFFIYAAADP